MTTFRQRVLARNVEFSFNLSFQVVKKPTTSRVLLNVLPTLATLVRDTRDLKIVVYGKRLTSDTLFAIKTKSLTVKCFAYRIYSKYRKLRIQTLCLTTETWRLILNDFVFK